MTSSPRDLPHGLSLQPRRAGTADPAWIRRRMLLRLGGLPLLPGLTACSPKRFESIDLTGADYGRDFRLTDPEGRARSLADFRGMVVLLFFGFTQCPDVCPTALARAVEVRQLLGALGQKLQVIFATIDPERDSGAVLGAYTRAFSPDFLGLRGDLQTTAETARNFKVFFAKVPTGSSYTMDHTAISYAFDPGGRLRLAIAHTQPAASVAADLRRLLDGA